MPKDPGYLKRLKEYAKGEFTTADFIAVEREMYDASDRASVVVLATLTEDAIELLLMNNMRGDLSAEDRRLLFGFDGVAGTFSSKVHLAYAMKLIGPKTRRELDLIRTLRNTFAHAKKAIRFDVPEVSAVCAELRFPDEPDADRPSGPLDLEAQKLSEPWCEARVRFHTSCRTLTNRMLLRTLGDVLSGATQSSRLP